MAFTLTEDMDYKTAMQVAMKKPVRRKEWPAGVKIMRTFKDPNDLSCSLLLKDDTGLPLYMKWHQQHEDFTATDWELYQPKQENLPGGFQTESVRSNTHPYKEEVVADGRIITEKSHPFTFKELKKHVNYLKSFPDFLSSVPEQKPLDFKKRIVYIAHKISGDINANLEDLKRIIRAIYARTSDIVPFCPYYADVMALDDNNPAQREIGLENGKRIISSGIVEELWLVGPEISKGMAAEAEMASKMGIPIMDFTKMF